MAIDVRRLRPSVLTRMLNSTALGEVISERQLRRHRNRAGYRIGDDKHIDLLRYTAWLVWRRHHPEPGKPPADYEAVKEAARARNAALSASGRDIGDIPQVIDPLRKGRSERDFRYFCESYFPLTFCLAWSEDHLKVIARIETAVLQGGLFAMAMPRGSGKALALDTPLATPTGWTTMGQVQVGDTLFDDQGIACRVVYATDVQHGRPCYRVVFSDGQAIVCDADHLWTVHDRYARRNPRTLRTADMAERVVLTTHRGWPEHRYSIPGPRPCPPARNRFITAIEPTASVPVRCIQVDSPSQLYLAGRKMVPTHNTTLAETACIWAMLTGARDFVCLIGSDAGHARSMLESIKVEFETNDYLLEDYPEAVFPIHSLERIHNRAQGQLCNGRPTRIVWTADEIVLPTIEGSRASGAIIRVAGIESRIRGMKFKRADGRAVRPSLVVLDDPQTDESARSDPQVRARMETLNGAILNLAGPGQKISGIMPCTVIRPGDMADQILDRDKHPAWQGQRTQLVYAFPTNQKLWDQYAQIRADSFRNDGDGRQATVFYRKHRKQMDAGAVIAWPQRYNEDELSAIQHAMNLRLQDERAFWAEYQNQPLPQDEGDSEQLTPEAICAKTNGYTRGTVPIGCNHLTMFIDVQAKLLFYVVAAWEDDFSGYVVDYGAYPDQQRPIFTLRDAQKTLSRAAPGAGLEGGIYDGLDKLTESLLGHNWRRDDGADMRIERCLIDANWGQSTDVVYQFCRQSQYAGIVMPSHGRYVGASSVPFSEYKRKRGERIGHHWRIPNVQGKRQIRHVVIDTNYYKSFIHERLSVAMGDTGCLSLFGRRPAEHQLLAEHLTAEYRVRTEARGRVVDEWKLRLGSPDNHWFDCLVGCAVAASIQGCVLAGTETQVAAKPRIRLSQLQAQRTK